MSLNDNLPLLEHDLESDNCRKGDCRYLELSDKKCFRNNCKGKIHATDSNWDDYGFGHGGYVYFDLKCNLCSYEEKGALR